MGIEFELSSLVPEEAGELQQMTFPAYRHLLPLEPRPRHPQEDTRLIQPFGVVARVGGSPAGLALAEGPHESGDEEPPQLLSVFVRADRRNQGIGTALVEATENEARRRGYRELTGLYTTGRPAIEFVEKIMDARGWQTDPFSLSVRFDPAQALTSSAFDERKIEILSRGFEIFPWSELTEEEYEVIRESDERLHWIEPKLAPWVVEGSQLHWSSVGARYKGRVVGWVLNHSVLPGVVRFTISYMRKDLSRRGRILALYHRSLVDIRDSGRCQFCTFLTPYSYPNMIGFINRWITPISSFVGESRKVRVSLEG